MQMRIRAAETVPHVSFINQIYQLANPIDNYLNNHIRKCKMHR